MILKVKMSEIKLKIQFFIAGNIEKIAHKYKWFYRVYSWYFQRFRFNKNCEYGAMKVVFLSDEYDEEKMASIFNWQVKMLIPENLHSKIEYIKCKGSCFMKDTIGWIYSGTG